mgnify:CR=1 FL=1
MIGANFLDLAFLAAYDRCTVFFSRTQGGGDSFDCYAVFDDRFVDNGTRILEISSSNSVTLPSRALGWTNAWSISDGLLGLAGVDTMSSYRVVDSYGVFYGTYNQNGTGWASAWNISYGLTNRVGTEDFESYGTGSVGTNSYLAFDQSFYGTVFGFSGSWVFGT